MSTKNLCRYSSTIALLHPQELIHQHQERLPGAYERLRTFRAVLWHTPHKVRLRYQLVILNPSKTGQYRRSIHSIPRSQDLHFRRPFKELFRSRSKSCFRSRAFQVVPRVLRSTQSIAHSESCFRSSRELSGRPKV